MKKEENTFDPNLGIPKHIAIIMDGNGRWAKQRGLARSAGHAQGVDTVFKITEDCVRLGIEYLTLYTFSTENWNRPSSEVQILMQLLLDNLDDGIFMRNNVRFRMIGGVERLPEGVRERVKWLADRTAGNTGMTVVIALNYSSRWELTNTMQQICQDVASGTVKSEDVTEELISDRLQTHFMPDPDLLIRTGGEIRISNFLLWQCAYSEFYFCDTFWPDFDKEELLKAVAAYQKRQRRYGKTGDQIEEENAKQ